MIAYVLMEVVAKLAQLLADLLEIGLHQLAAIQAQVAEAMDCRNLLVHALHVQLDMITIFIVV